MRTLSPRWRSLTAALLLSAAPAWAQDAECADRCQAAADSLRARCVDARDRDCAAIAAAGQAQCLDQCVPFDPPSDAELETLARQIAARVSDARLTRYEAIDYLGAGDVPQTRLFVFVTGRPPAPGAVREAGFDLAAWDDRFVCVEVGLVPDVPPVVGYWAGAPVEYLALAEARASVARDLRLGTAAVARRYGGAIAPVLALRDGRGRVGFFSTSSRHTTDRFEVRAAAGDRRGSARAAQFQTQWTRHLNRVRAAR